MLRHRLLGDAEAGEERQQALAALGRQLRPFVGRRRWSIAAGFHCGCATIRAKKFGQKLRVARTKWPANHTLPGLPIVHAAKVADAVKPAERAFGYWAMGGRAGAWPSG